MSLRALAVLLLLLAAVAFGLFRLKGNEEATPASEETPLVAPFAESAVRRVEVRCTDTSYLLTAAGTAWRVAPPVDAPADPRQVRSLLGALGEARIRKVVAAEPADRAGFGLDPAECAVTLTVEGDAAGRALALGRTSPVGTDRYASAADRRVVLVDGSLYGAVARPGRDFVERRVLPFEPDEVTRLTIERPDATIAVRRDGAAWRLEAPVHDLADFAQATAAVRGAVTLEAGGDPLPQAPRGPAIAITITGGVPARTERALVATGAIEGKRLVWRPNGPVLGTVDESTLDDVLRPASAFRDRQVLSFSTPEVLSIAITRGPVALTVSRDSLGTAWTVRTGAGEAQPAEEARVQALLDRCRDVRAGGAGEGAPPGEATGEIAFRGAAGELARARWGPSAPREGTETVWLTTPSRPGIVFHLAASSFGPIPASAADLVAKP